MTSTDKPATPTVAELQAKLDALYQLYASGRLLVDAREIAEIIGPAPLCSCPEGPANWRRNPDVDCDRHGQRLPDAKLVAALLPHIEEAARWTLMPWRDPSVALKLSSIGWQMGQHVNIVAAVIARLTDPAEDRV